MRTPTVWPNACAFQPHYTWQYYRGSQFCDGKARVTVARRALVKRADCIVDLGRVSGVRAIERWVILKAMLMLMLMLMDERG